MTIDRRPTKAILADNKSIRAELDSHPFIDAANDLFPSSHAGSFFIVSYVEDGGSRFTVLFHLMFLLEGLGKPVVQLAISVFNEKTKYYFSKEMNYFWLDKTSVAPQGLDYFLLDKTSVAPQGLDIATPGGSLSGTIDSLLVKGQIVKGSERFEMNLKMEPRGPVLRNLLTGVIPFSDGVDYEYALPRMETSGEMTVDGKRCKVTGWSWLDREWGTLGPSKWTWMNIQLENDVQMSIWDEQTDNKKPDSHVGGTEKQRFATILSPNGDLIAASVAIEELRPWRSTRTNRAYANKWRVTIPGRAELFVELLHDEQEIVSEVGLHRVEGKAAVEGTYNKQKTTGVTLVEMFNLFPFFAR